MQYWQCALVVLTLTMACGAVDEERGGLTESGSVVMEPDKSGHLDASDSVLMEPQGSRVIEPDMSGRFDADSKTSPEERGDVTKSDSVVMEPQGSRVIEPDMSGRFDADSKTSPEERGDVTKSDSFVMEPQGSRVIEPDMSGRFDADSKTSPEERGDVTKSDSFVMEPQGSLVREPDMSDPDGDLENDEATEPHGTEPDISSGHFVEDSEKMENQPDSERYLFSTIMNIAGNPEHSDDEAAKALMNVTASVDRRGPLATEVFRVCNKEKGALLDGCTRILTNERVRELLNLPCTKDVDCMGDHQEGYLPLVCCIDVVENIFSTEERRVCRSPARCKISQTAFDDWFRAKDKGDDVFSKIRSAVTNEVDTASSEDRPIDWRIRLKEMSCDAGKVRDQGTCGSCSGFAVSTAFSQRLCLLSKKNMANVFASVNDIASLYKQWAHGRLDRYQEFRNMQHRFLEESRKNGGKTNLRSLVHDEERRQLVQLPGHFVHTRHGMWTSDIVPLMSDSNGISEATRVMSEGCHPYRCHKLSKSTIGAVRKLRVLKGLLGDEKTYQAKKDKMTKQGPGAWGAGGRWRALRQVWDDQKLERDELDKNLKTPSFMMPSMPTLETVQRCDQREIPFETGTAGSPSGFTFYVGPSSSDTSPNSYYKHRGDVQSFQPLRDPMRSIRMMENELRENGPVVISVDVHNLRSLKLVPSTNRHDGAVVQVRVPEDIVTSPHTNHAMVVVGWVDADPISYWIIQNSWGVSTGQSGYEYVQKGFDRRCIANDSHDRPSACGVDFLYSMSYQLQMDTAELFGMEVSPKTLAAWNSRNEMCSAEGDVKGGCAHGYYDSDCVCQCNLEYTRDQAGRCTACSRKCENGRLNDECQCECDKGYAGSSCEMSFEVTMICPAQSVFYNRDSGLIDDKDGSGTDSYRVYFKLTGVDSWPEGSYLNVKPSDYDAIDYVIRPDNLYSSGELFIDEGEGTHDYVEGHFDFRHNWKYKNIDGKVLKIEFIPVTKNEFGQLLSMPPVPLPEPAPIVVSTECGSSTIVQDGTQVFGDSDNFPSMSSFGSYSFDV